MRLGALNFLFPARGKMRLTRWIPLLLVLTAAPALHADATIRYKAQFKLGTLLPASVVQQASANLTSQKVFESAVQYKGDKEYVN
jgi:hypothetical protein